VPDEASPENAARKARYQVFSAQLGENEILLLAHHADDQAETVLYRLLRRSGPRGLAGMPRSRRVGRATLMRPFLALDRHTLVGYAQEKSLIWVEDESNFTEAYDRNFLRNKIVPTLRSRWPDYAARLGATAFLCQQTESLTEDLARIDLGNLVPRDERTGWSIEIPPFLLLSHARKINVLRYFARIHALQPMGYRVTEEVLCTLLKAANDRNPLVRWPGGEWRRFRHRLYLGPSVATDKNDTSLPAWHWAIEETLVLIDGATLAAVPVVGQGLAAKYCDNLTVAFRRGGERCQPNGRRGSAGLKKLFQEHAVESWLRSQVPLVCAAGKLIAVGDLWVCQGFEAGAGEKGYLIQWRHTTSQ
jgi:tRNA(Ile)-lysidine synthase